MSTFTQKKINWLFLLVVSLVTSSLPSLGQTISGTVFRDFNSNGAYESISNPASYTYGEPGVPGVTVTAYDATGVAVATTISSTVITALGTYTLTVGNTNAYRVEFTSLTTGDYEAFRGAGNATSVQFVNGGDTSVNLGVNYPADYCQSVSPQLVTTCFVAVNATNTPILEARPAMVGVPYTVVEGSKVVTDYATVGEIGAAWGIAYKNDTKQIFAAAFTKRHVGFSDGGPNAIYITNVTSATSGNTTEFFNFTTVGGTAVTSTTEAHGNDLPTPSTGSPTSADLSSYDIPAFDAVGKTSLGSLDISDDDKTLYVVNLKDQKLYTIDIASKAVTNSVTVPNPGCTTSNTAVVGSYRPFAVKYYRGKVYIGVVCTREDAGTTTAPYGPTPGLSATVYAVDPSAPATFNTVLSFPLTYQKAPSNADQSGQDRAEYWRPWTSIYQADRDNGTNLTAISYPQAWLTDIEFEPGTGDMLVGLRDRFGDQIGYKNHLPIAGSTRLVSAISPGELLRARKCNLADATWTLEDNGLLCGTATSSSAIQTTVAGPGGGKYYWGDRVQNGGNHGMSSQGGLAQLAGSAKVAMTAIDPLDVFNTGGIKRLINATGAKDGNATGTATNPNAGAEFYTANALGYGKANGLGGLDELCDQAPIEIGNRVWLDANDNGVQDPGEAPLAGVSVTLNGPGLPAAGISVVTNAQGEYFFSSSTSFSNTTGFAYSLTGLTGGSSYSLTFPTNFSTVTLSGRPNSASGVNADNIDTDPGANGVIAFTLGQAGQNNFSYDAGYVPPASLGDFVFVDTNANGQQDAGDTPIPGVTVTLLSSGTLVATTTTNASGLYSFTGLTPGVPYSVSFTAPAGYTATLQNTGNDITDSDGDPVTGLTGVYSLTAGENNPTVDMGYYIPASLGDFVFIDANQNGIQDSGEAPILGVVVTLYTNGVVSATTVTNASGLYSFTGLTPGSSLSYSVGFTTPSGYSATIPLSGTDKALDSDPVGGVTASVTLASGENNPTLDAGFYLLPAGLGDYVFLDANQNGIQDSGEAPIAGVTVTLYTNGVVSATTLTNASGLYSFTGLTPGSSLSYSVGFTAPTGYTATLANQGADDAKDSDADVLTGRTQSVTLAPGEFNPTLDAGFFLPSASLGDFVFVDTNKDGVQQPGEPGIPGVVVTLISNGTVVASTTTNTSGIYSFTGLTPGVPYSVSFTTPAGYTATLAQQGGDDTKDSDANPVTGQTRSVTLAPGENNPNLDAGFYPTPAGLGDYVFLDANKNGIQDGGEAPIAGVTVTLYTNGVVSATTLTNASGLYSFTGLTPGSSLSYSVGFTAPAGLTATLQNQGADDAKDSDADVLTGRTQSVTLAPGEFNPTLDAGFYLPSASLGDFVFVDTNKDGVQQPGEPGIPGVIVTLISNGTVVASTTTNASGLYSFTGLTPAVPYSVSFTTPTGYTATSAQIGGDDTKDSDANPVTGQTRSVTLAPGENNPNLDAGFYPTPAGLGDYVFLDANKNGIQDSGEAPIAGVTVTLYTNGVVSATTLTNASGLYSFTGLTPGSSLSYSVGFTAPAGLTTTTAHVGANTAIDSDADLLTGRTQSVTLAPGEFNPTLDAGFYAIPPSFSLVKLVDKSVAVQGDTLTYTLVLTNTGPRSATNVVVRDSTNGLSLLAGTVVAPAGTTLTQGLPISLWTVSSITAGQSLSLTYKAIVDSTGVIYNTATIPGVDLPQDTVKVCTSVPIKLCPGDEYTLTAPAGRASYSWYRNGVLIVGATTNSLTVTQAGSYSLSLSSTAGSSCPDFSCCPVIVELDSLPVFGAAALPATCVGSVPQANGQLVITGFKPTHTYQYSAGATFNPAASLSGGPKVIPVGGVLASTLASPVVGTLYTIRVYNGSGCYVDQTVLLMPTICGCPAEVCVPYVIQQTKRLQRIGDPR